MSNFRVFLHITHCLLWEINSTIIDQLQQFSNIKPLGFRLFFTKHSNNQHAGPKFALRTYISARVMDCEEMEFEDESFDCVFGRAILHHLNIEKSLGEVQRVLKDGGRAVFMEPLGMNPFINLFRYFTPSRRTPDEKPFSRQEFELFKQAGFKNFEHHEFSFATNMGIFFEAVLKWRLFRYQTLKRTDDFLLSRLSFLRRFCWNTVLVFER